MSLLNKAYEEMAMLERKLTPDGEGGFDVSWRDGVHFQAAVNFDSSMQAKIAEKQGVTSLYTVTFPLNVKLEYHMVFKRLRDGKIFRVTSDGDDVVTPESASFQFAQVTAEEWIPA